MGKLSFLYNQQLNRIEVSFPLTSPTGKIRVRKRTSNSQYGYQVYKNDVKDSNCYIDWQIEYDTKDISESFSQKRFIRRTNNEQKYLYSLSDFINFFYNLNAVSRQDLINIKNDLLAKTSADLISTNPNLITQQFRGSINCQATSISGFPIVPYSTSFPTYVISLNGGIDVEVGLFEGGFATSSLMPHLYVCIPFNLLANFNQLNNKASAKNDVGKFIIDSNNINIFVKVFHILGLLKESHRLDVLDIIDAII